MEIIHVSAECYPAAKVGGLGDVVGALPKYLNRQGHVAKVVMPHYKNKFFQKHTWEITHEGGIHLGSRWFHYTILKEKNNVLEFDLYQVEIPGLLQEEFPYGYPNDTERHLGFQIAVTDWLNGWQHRPDIIHCHDHHSGLIPFMITHAIPYRKLRNVATIFTIHNGNYQGWIGWDKAHLLPPFDATYRGMLEWGDCINSLASAIKCSWRFTTVSNGYLEELSQSALGLDPLIRSERKKAAAILNGIDVDVWNPETDTTISENYDGKNADAGKRKNKEVLCSEFSLDVRKPLFAFIGRLVPDKGADLLADSILHAVREEKARINFLVLGSGMNEYENILNGLRHSIPENFNCYIGYHERLSHLIYAGADFLLMPSRIEPCGLNQLYALRYGTIPIVGSVGGLKDTVTDVEEKNGFGFLLKETTVDEISHAVARAVLLAQKKELLTSIRQTIMGIDHSWEHATEKYVQLYEGILVA